MKKKVYESAQLVAEAFAAHFVQRVENSNTLSVAISGGSTPKILFDILAQNHADLDWSKVHFYWGDERCVPPGDDDSNYKMTVTHLLSKINIPQENIHRVSGENDPTVEALSYSQQLETNLPSVNDLPQFDLVILGMGGDGHTASIFPYEIELLYSEHTCEVATHPDSGQKRITLTGRVINNAAEVCFLVTGSSKSEKIDEIFHQRGEWEKYPAAYIKPNSGQLTWYLDQVAAASL